jgi:hypothetical protein
VNALDHIFIIDLTCPDATVGKCPSENSTPIRLEYNVTDILNTLSVSGWPICPECGCDLDYCVIG